MRSHDHLVLLTAWSTDPHSGFRRRLALIICTRNVGGRRAGDVLCSWSRHQVASLDIHLYRPAHMICESQGWYMGQVQLLAGRLTLVVAGTVQHRPTSAAAATVPGSTRILSQQVLAHRWPRHTLSSGTWLIRCCRPVSRLSCAG